MQVPLSEDLLHHKTQKELQFFAIRNIILLTTDWILY